LPSDDRDESLAILRDRDAIKIDGIDADRYFLELADANGLSSQVVMTEGKTPEQTCAEILQHIGSRDLDLTMENIDD
jgi:hypothetical protein